MPSHFFLRITSAAAVITLTAFACGNPDSSTSRIIVRDSAGVRIVDIPAHPRAISRPGTLPYQLMAERELSIGVADGDEAYTFGRVSGVDATPDGRIVVLDAQQLLIRVYSPDGRALARMGGRGGGPAELMAVGDLWLRGDTIIVHDRRNRKVVRFTAAGKFLNSRAVGQTSHPAPGGLYRPLGDVGFIVTSATGCSLPRTPERVDNQWIGYITDRDGGVVDTLDVRMVSTALPVYGESFCTAFSLPFGRNVLLTHASDGRWAMGDAENYEIRIFRIRSPNELVVRNSAAETRLAAWTYDVMVLRRQFEQRPLSDGERQRFRKVTLEQIEEAEVRIATEKALGAFRYPASWPAYSALRFDDAGQLWVLKTAPRLSSDDAPPIGVWDVYAPDGSVLHEVQLPPGISVRSIRDNLIYGTYVDELGVNYVGRWRLVPAREPSASDR